MTDTLEKYWDWSVPLIIVVMVGHWLAGYDSQLDMVVLGGALIIVALGSILFEVRGSSVNKVTVVGWSMAAVIAVLVVTRMYSGAIVLDWLFWGLAPVLVVVSAVYVARDIYRGRWNVSHDA